jgi:hypothetical protein
MTPEQTLAADLTKSILGVLAEDHDVSAEEIAAFPKAAKFSWPEQVIEIGQQLPFDPRFIAFDAFEGNAHDPLEDASAGDIRIYCMPSPEFRVALPYLRLKMSRMNPSGSRFVYTEKGFIDEIAQEWAKIVERLTPEEEDADDGVRCDSCGHFTSVAEEDTGEEEEDVVTPEPLYCGNCGKHLPAVATAMTGDTTADVVQQS